MVAVDVFVVLFIVLCASCFRILRRHKGLCVCGTRVEYTCCRTYLRRNGNGRNRRLKSILHTRNLHNFCTNSSSCSGIHRIRTSCTVGSENSRSSYNSFSYRKVRRGIDTGLVCSLCTMCHRSNGSNRNTGMDELTSCSLCTSICRIPSCVCQVGNGIIYLPGIFCSRRNARRNDLH